MVFSLFSPGVGSPVTFHATGAKIGSVHFAIMPQSQEHDHDHFA
jgi:hypothetical protein